MGLFLAISKAFFSQSPDYFFKKYLVPIFLACYVLLLPVSNVYIEDLVTQEGFSVTGVPMVLAKTASVISSVGYRITKALELVLHTPNDKNYNATGMIFGAETYLDSKTFKIRNADLEYNLKSVCKNCVLYDLALNRYSFDDLKKSDDVWAFLKHNTSKTRMINFYNLKGLSKTDSSGNGNTYIPCCEAMERLSPAFEKEKNYFAKQEIIKNLPLRYQALTGLQMDADKLISQQLMFGVLKDGLKGRKFAESRAYTQQRSTYQIMGSLAGTSLVTMRAVFEALIYMSFIFIAPMVLLPGGYAFAKNWLWMAGWLQLWPPFYAILNFVMHIVARSRADDILLGTGSSQSLCYIDQMGLENFYTDVHALSGYLMLSVPFISYAILKGGVQSLIHMAGSMMSPAYSAATSAASEMNSGNYSYANVSYGQNSFGNTTRLQRNTAPSLTHGFIQENRGSYSETYGEECILNQNTSNLRTGVVSEESISQSLNDSYQNSVSSSESSQKMFQESVSSHGRSSYDLVNTLSNSENYTSNISARESQDMVESARSCQNIAKSVGEQLGIDEHQSFQLLSNGGLNSGILQTVGITCGTQMTKDQRASVSEAMNSSEFASLNEDFQKNYQTVQDFTSSRAHNTLSEEGIRKSDAFTQSLDEVMSSSEQHQASVSRMEQASEQLSLYQNSSGRLTHNLNQDFVDFASERYGGFAAASQTIRNGAECEKQAIYGDFFNNLVSKYSVPEQSADSFYSRYDNAGIKQLNKEAEISSLYSGSAGIEASNGLNRGGVVNKATEIESDRSFFQQHSNSQRQQISSNVNERSQRIEEKHTVEQSKTVQGKVLSSTESKLGNTIQSLSDNVFVQGFKSVGESLNEDLMQDGYVGYGINQMAPMWTAKED